MTSMRSAFSVALVLAFVLGPTSVQAQDARLSNEVDTTLITVGDQIRMTVMVEHAAGAQVVWPDSLDLSPFEVLGARGLAPSTEGDRVRSGAVLTLTAFEVGELEIPSFDVQVAGPGDARQSLSTDRFGIEVVTVGADEGGDIRGIRGPLWIPVSVIRVGVWLLLLFAALAIAIWFYGRRRRGEVAPEVASVPPRPAHEIALEELARIEASPLLERGQVKQYHIEISEALRSYVEARFLVRALEMTTREVVDGLRHQGASGDFIEELTRFLDQCDMVKFAKVRPDEERSRAALVLGRGLVERTRPVDEPETNEAPGGSAAAPLDENPVTSSEESEPVAAPSEGSGQPVTSGEAS